MSITITPSLQLRKTLSHPIDPAVVLGFLGRDTRAGAEAIVFKGDALPVVRSNPAVTHYVLPEEQAAQAVEDGRWVYILDENYVYRVPLTAVEDAPVHTGKKYGQSMTGRKVAVEDMQQWPRGAIEVAN